MPEKRALPPATDTKPPLTSSEQSDATIKPEPSWQPTSDFVVKPAKRGRGRPPKDKTKPIKQTIRKPWTPLEDAHLLAAADKLMASSLDVKGDAVLAARGMTMAKQRWKTLSRRIAAAGGADKVKAEE